MSLPIAQLLTQLQYSIDWSIPGIPDHGAITDSGLATLLQVHNGLSAFNGGLRIFGTAPSLLPSIDEWNQPNLWRSEYKGLDDGLTFFAEDVFGNQFGLEKTGAVVRFLAETGDRESCGANTHQWLERILADPEEELALWLLREWTQGRRTLKLSEHLCPKIPFVAKGAYEPPNLYMCDRVESMRFKGNFAHQIRNLPTGATIEIKVR